MRVTPATDKTPLSYWRFPWLKWGSGVAKVIRVVRDRQGKQAYVKPPDDWTTAEVYYPLDGPPGISEEFSKLKTADDVQRFAARYGMLGLWTTTDVYYPLDGHPGEEFSKLKTEAIENPLNLEDDVRQFATRYGTLAVFNPTIATTIVGGQDSARDGIQIYQLHGTVKALTVKALNAIRDGVEERVDEWLKYAAEVRQTIQVWRAVENRDVRRLREIIRWNGSSVSIKFSDSELVPVPRWMDPGRLPPWKPGDVFGPAKLFIAERYNLRVRGMASPTMLVDSMGNFQPRNTPATLLGVIWLELGERITGKRKLIQCKSCPQYLDLSKCRSDKEICGRCRERLKKQRYRARLKQKGMQHGQKTRAR